MSQETLEMSPLAASSASDASATPAKAKPSDELASPRNLLMYPPLAYLLNSFMSCLNYVRDCPLAALKQVVLECIDTHCSDLAKFLVDVSPDMRLRGSKYLEKLSSGSGKLSKTAGGTAGSGPRGTEHSQNTASAENISVEDGKLTLDVQYGLAMGDALIPHIFRCFLIIYGDSSESEDSSHQQSTGVTTGYVEKCRTVLAAGGIYDEKLRRASTDLNATHPAGNEVTAAASSGRSRGRGGAGRTVTKAGDEASVETV